VHELSIVQALLDQVQTEVENSGQRGRVVSLQLVIGRLSGVHVDSIRLGFELLSPDSIAAGADLCIEQPKARCQCAVCGAAPEIDEIVVCCPACGEPNITICGGQELLLQSIELEE
jgi:hydrogenase nickel incorporation protein HypA/HybF